MQPIDRYRQSGRISIPLAVRLFLGMALLIALAVGAAVFVTWVQGREIARQAVDKAVNISAAVQREFEQRRLDQLQLAVRLIAADAGFIKYIADASGNGGLPGLGGDEEGNASTRDTRSMRDLLLERQHDFGMDMAILLDPSGEVLARTDENEAFATSLSDDSLVAPAISAATPFSGYWRQGDRLYQAAIMPLARDQDLIGFLLVAMEVNDALSQAVAKVSSAEIAFWLPTKDDATLIASSLDAAAAKELAHVFAEHKAQWMPAVQAGRSIDHVPMHFSGQEWSARFVPAAAPGEGQLGSVAIMSPTDQITGSYRAILNRVVLAGLVSMLVAILLSIFLAQRILRPIGRMAKAAEAAAAGDYRTHIGTESSDVLGRLARAFDSLLSDLREKNDIEGYVGQMARFLPEPAAETATVAALIGVPLIAPQHENLTLLEVEFRHLLGAVDTDTDVQQRANAYAGIQDLLGALAASEEIELVAMDGARWRLLVDGKQRLQEAVRIWALLLRDCGRLNVPLPAGALVDGDLVRASGTAGQTSQSVTLGIPVAHADRLLCDAAAGQLLLTRSVGEALKTDLPTDALNVVAGGFSGKKYYTVAATALPALGERTAVTRTKRTVAAKAVATGTPARGSDITTGSILGDRYRIISQLGEGGMGVVYKAHDLELDDVVALKMLRPGLLVDSEQLDRLKSEIKLARRITHPNVLRTFDFGEVGGRPYISMEYVRGLTLRYLLSEAKRVPYSAALRIARQLAAGLAAAHEVGVLHRDIKPENLILEANGNAKLMDFGIARPVRRNTPGHTEAGTFVGTPDYCSPEQLSAGEVDERSDIYACGVLMSEMFCGGKPFVGGNTMEIYQAQISDAPVSPSSLWADIPPELESVILRCVRCSPAARFASAAELGAALSRLRS
ncbi:MAG: protein kinase [Xanthomonadales bacterium]|nr:protein kinase [Xanthomonadales bacterium]